MWPLTNARRHGGGGNGAGEVEVIFEFEVGAGPVGELEAEGDQHQVRCAVKDADSTMMPGEHSSSRITDCGKNGEV